MLSTLQTILKKNANQCAAMILKYHLVQVESVKNNF